MERNNKRKLEHKRIPIKTQKLTLQNQIVINQEIQVDEWITNEFARCVKSLESMRRDEVNEMMYEFESQGFKHRCVCHLMVTEETNYKFSN